MADMFDACLAFTLREEGGYVAMIRPTRVARPIWG
jgi:hypothetical protein